MPKSRGFALNQVSEANRLRILGLIREKGQTSRTELAHLTDLSLPAVSRVVGLLIEQGYVREVGFSSSRGGRRPIMLETIPDAGYVIGADLGGTSVLAAVIDLHGQVIHVTEEQHDDVPVINALNAAIHAAINQLPANQRERLLGIGVGTPGLLDYASGLVITAANLGWKNVPLRDQLQAEFNLPVFVDNDANTVALAEWSQGAAREASHLVCLTVSRGLGAGIILNGQVYRGAGGTAGEIGETFIRESEQGWQPLEELCSGRALVSQARTALEHGETSALRLACKGQPDSLSLEMILEAARSGDMLAVRLVQRAAGYLGVGIANVVNIFDPQLVIVGGMLAEVGNLLFDPIRETLDRLLLPVMRQKVQIVPGRIGEHAGVIGAASLVLYHVFAPPLQHGDTVSLLPM